MRDAFFKAFPIAFGGAFAWLLFRPPEWVADLGALGFLVHAGLAVALVLAAGLVSIVTAIPAHLRMEPLPDSAVPPELAELSASLRQLGFGVAGPPWRVHVAPSATLLGFVHERHPVYATVFRTGTVPARTSFDFVSILEGERGALTTMFDAGGASLPAGPGWFRQVCHGGAPDALFERHLEGLAWLGARGLAARPVSAARFEPDFTDALARQRALVLSSPLTATCVAVWRAATRRDPFVGRLADQTIAARQIARLAAD